MNTYTASRLRLFSGQLPALKHLLLVDLLGILDLDCEGEEEREEEEEEVEEEEEEVEEEEEKWRVACSRCRAPACAMEACRKVVERPNRGRPTDRLPGKVVTVDEFRTSRFSSAMNSPQPCEAGLDRSKPTMLEGWKPQPGGNTKERLPAKGKEYPALGIKKLRD
ncbi:hypothetical protein QJQ45_009662 [Haematococcus lacustris]|nr:hypothetical protein QJQ45_009662 [Haematococcus lacustris]